MRINIVVGPYRDPNPAAPPTAPPFSRGERAAPQTPDGSRPNSASSRARSSAPSGAGRSGPSIPRSRPPAPSAAPSGRPGGAACPPRASRSPAAPRSRARPRRRRTIPRTATARATCPAASPRAPLRTRPARGRNPRESRNHRADEVVARRPAHDNDRESARHSPIKAQLDIRYIIDHRSMPPRSGATDTLDTPLRSLLRARVARRVRHSRLPREREHRNPHAGHRAACTHVASQDHSRNGRSAEDAVPDAARRRP